MKPLKNMPNPKISLVIPAYNEEKYIGECLQSAQKHAANFCEIIVINNASTDRTAEVAKSFPGVRVVDEPRKGLTKARQRGLTEASGDIIAFIDADTKMPEKWIKKIKHLFEKDAETVCVSGPYIYYDMHVLGRAFVWAYWIFLARIAYLFTRYMAVGGNFAAKKSALETAGGFDPNISFYGEDTDIARRLHQIGKVKFKQNLYMYTSARRFRGEGLIVAGTHYIINFLSIVFTKKSATADYKDIR